MSFSLSMTRDNEHGEHVAAYFYGVRSLTCNMQGDWIISFEKGGGEHDYAVERFIEVEKREKLLSADWKVMTIRED